MSVWWSTRSPRACSGDMNCGVPMSTPAWVRDPRTVVDIVAPVARSGQLGNAEVEELGQAVRANHHVVRFDIAMHDPRGMRLVQRRGNLSCDIENEPVIERLRSLELGQRLPVDELGGDEMRALDSPIS